MNQEKIKNIPIEIKRFNWGALLLSCVWGIRHGVWISLLTFIPIVGWICMPIILGFKGNEWAWKKNTYTSVDQFLKRQRRWAIAAVAIYLTIFSTLFYFLNYSDSVKMTLSILNKNDKVVEYLGEHIHKDTYFGNVSYSDVNNVVKIETIFKVKGSKKSGNAHLEFRVGTDQIFIDKLIIFDDADHIIISN